MSGNRFKPAWWLPNSHLQTLWPAILRNNIKNMPLLRERLELPDGDFIDLDWLDKDKSGPLVLVLHGFEGSIESHYAKGMMLALNKKGWRVVFMHFRGCSGEPNRLPRSYHSGETTDLSYVMRVIYDREPLTKFAAIGYSLGGNVLLKWMGEIGYQNPLEAAVAISVPFELHNASSRIQRGFSQIYQWYFLKCLRDRLAIKFKRVPPSVNVEQLNAAKTMYEFDDKYTAPLHGFANADEYYNMSSSRRYLRSIQAPTLLLHAKDDPFMTTEAIPSANELSPTVSLEVYETGGHVGFVSGRYPWWPEYWLEKRVPSYLKDYL